MLRPHANPEYRGTKTVAGWRHAMRWEWILVMPMVMAVGLGCSDDAASSGGDGTESQNGAATSAGNSGGSGSGTKNPNSGGGQAAIEHRSPEELVTAGRSLYMGNCIACHNVNPAQDGALGPAVAGASHELLEARVVRGVYPEGYAPKRPTRVMVPMPHLEPKIDELTAYLQSL